MKINELKGRLANYPGPHRGEEWKLETDLSKCSPKEKDAIARLGLTLEDLAGFNRGEVAHMLWGYKWTNTTKTGTKGS